MRKRKELTEEMLIDWWLTKYHNTTLKEVFAQHPDWTSKEFYPTFAVTEEQHNEWHDWMIKELMKYFCIGKKAARKDSWAIYLNTSPSVKTEKL